VNDDRGTLEEIRQKLDRETVAGLRARARDARVTVNTLVRAVWGLLLARYGGQRDVAFAVTVAGRPPELDGAEEIVGPFINNVPVVVTDPGDAPLDAWLAALQERHARAEPHQWCSPAEIQRWSDTRPSRPLCETLLVFQNYPGRHEFPPLGERTRAVRWVSGGPSIRTGFPLTLTVTMSEDPVLRTTHDSAVLSRPGMERLHEDVAAMLVALARGARVAAEQFLRRRR
jgi:non-ribosomal peptide synthetase component F